MVAFTFFFNVMTKSLLERLCDVMLSGTRGSVAPWNCQPAFHSSDGWDSEASEDSSTDVSLRRQTWRLSTRAGKKKKIKINIGCRRVESGRMATSVCVFQSMVSSLIVDQPGDPVLHLISFLQRSNQSSKSWTATRWSCDSTHSPSIIGSQSGATFSQRLSRVFASGRQSNYGKWKQAKQKERQVRNS